MAPPFPFPPKPESPLYRHRQLAPNANVRVSPLCLGAMSFGDAHKARMGECSKDQAFEILDNFTKLGGNFIDTANSYQNGESEQWLGEWMKSRGNRDDIKEKIQSNYGGAGSKSLKTSVENSLKQLQTHYIDLLYVHWWDYNTSIPELMQNLNDLVASGKVLYLGISDTPAWVVSKCNEYARCHGLRQFVVYQGLWNAAIRDFERDIIPMCRDEGMGLVPWGAIGQGKFQTEEAYKEREKNNPGRQGKANATEKAVAKILESVAQEKKTALTSVALAYILQKAPYVFPLVGCRTLEHLKGNVDALNVALSEQDIGKIEDGYKVDPGFPHTFLSGSYFEPEGKPTVPDGPKDVWLTNIMGTFDYVEETKAIPLGKN